VKRRAGLARKWLPPGWRERGKGFGPISRRAVRSCSRPRSKASRAGAAVLAHGTREAPLAPSLDNDRFVGQRSAGWAGTETEGCRSGSLLIEAPACFGEQVGRPCHGGDHQAVRLELPAPPGALRVPVLIDQQPRRSGQCRQRKPAQGPGPGDQRFEQAVWGTSSMGRWAAIGSIVTRNKSRAIDTRSPHPAGGFGQGGQQEPGEAITDRGHRARRAPPNPPKARATEHTVSGIHGVKQGETAGIGSASTKAGKRRQAAPNDSPQDLISLTGSVKHSHLQSHPRERPIKWAAGDAEHARFFPRPPLRRFGGLRSTSLHSARWMPKARRACTSVHFPGEWPPKKPGVKTTSSVIVGCGPAPDSS